MIAPPPAALAALAGLDPRLTGADPQPLRGGRSNKVWRLGDFVIKSHSPDTASPLFPNDPGAEATALTRSGSLRSIPPSAGKGCRLDHL